MPSRHRSRGAHKFHFYLGLVAETSAVVALAATELVGASCLEALVGSQFEGDWGVLGVVPEFGVGGAEEAGVPRGALFDDFSAVHPNLERGDKLRAADRDAHVVMHSDTCVF